MAKRHVDQNEGKFIDRDTCVWPSTSQKDYDVYQFDEDDEEIVPNSDAESVDSIDHVDQDIRELLTSVNGNDLIIKSPRKRKSSCSFPLQDEDYSDSDSDEDQERLVIDERHPDQPDFLCTHEVVGTGDENPSRSTSDPSFANSILSPNSGLDSDEEDDVSLADDISEGDIDETDVRPILNYAGDIENYVHDEIDFGDNGWLLLQKDTGPSVHHFEGVPGLLTDLHGKEPADFFSTLFEERMFQIMAEETNNYAANSMKGKYMYYLHIFLKSNKLKPIEIHT